MLRLSARKIPDDDNQQHQSSVLASPLAAHPSSPSQSRNDVNRRHSKNNINESTINTNIAGIIMHLPGLQVKWAYEDWPDYLRSLCGAAVEGAFLLLLVASVYHYGQRVAFVSPPSSGWYHTMMLLKLNVASILMPVSFFSFIINTIVGDATYRRMSGNETPSPGVLRAGYSEARAHMMAQLTAEPFLLPMRVVFAVLCLAVSAWVYLYQIPCLRNKQNKRVNSGQGGWGVSRIHLVGFGLLAHYLNSIGWYTPVLNGYIALSPYSVANNGNQEFRRSKVINTTTTRTNNSTASTMNIIYIQHESLSGGIVLNTDEGARATPFFHDKMHNDADFYVLKHQRTVSGNTIDAMPALLTGCLPYTNEAVEWVHSPGRSIGYDFQGLNYATASFSSAVLGDSIKHGAYSMLYDMLASGCFDTIWDPMNRFKRMDNGEGVDERKMLPAFEEWVVGLDTNTTETLPKRPFYAQMYAYNQHYPYFKDNKNPSFSSRYFDSLLTTDQFLESLFRILEKTGHLENTIIIGSGDHGEDPFSSSYARVTAFTSNVLHTLSWVYYPRHLMSDPGVAERLRRNTNKLTSTLDIFPTIQSMLRGQYDVQQHTPDGCVTGVDLTSVEIPDERVTVSMNVASSQAVKGRGNIPWKAQLWAISTNSKGQELSLYHRKHKFKHPGLTQGMNNYYILEYGECARRQTDRPVADYCFHDTNDEYKALFWRSVEWLGRTRLYHAGFKSSEIVALFGNATKTNKNSSSVTTPIRKENLHLVLKVLVGWTLFGFIVIRVIRAYLIAVSDHSLACSGH